MKNFMIQGLKKKFICLLIFSFAVTSLPSQTYAGYGIAIDEENGNLPSLAIRVLLLNIDEQKVVEVNYYFPDREPHYSYRIPEGAQHQASPLLALVFNNQNLQEIVVKDDFTVDKYTVISKFPLRKASEDFSLPFTDNGDRYYKLRDIRALRNLTSIKIPTKKYRPNFRHINAENKVCKEDFLHYALGKNGDGQGGGEKEAIRYTKHKEKLGEYATLLTLLEYGYTKIYDTKLGTKGMDFMTFSGEDPLKESFFFIESKWTADTDGSLTHLQSELNSDRIIIRLKDLSQSQNTEHQTIIRILKNFFESSNLNLYKFLYKVFDSSKTDRSGGIAKPRLLPIDKAEKIKIAKAVGILKLAENEPDLITRTRSEGIETELNMDTLNSPEELISFLKYLQENDLDLNPAFLFLQQNYAQHYGQYKILIGGDTVMASSFMDSEEDKKEKKIKEDVQEMKKDIAKPLSVVKTSSSSEDSEVTSIRKKFSDCNITTSPNQKEIYTLKNLCNFLVYLNSEKKYTTNDIAEKIENKYPSTFIQKLINREDDVSQNYQFLWQLLTGKYLEEYNSWLLM